MYVENLGWKEFKHVANRLGDIIVSEKSDAPNWKSALTSA